MTWWDYLIRQPRTGSGVAAPLSERIAVLKLKKGETLVIKVAGRLSREQVAQLKQTISGCIPKGVKTLIADESLKFSKISPPPIKRSSRKQAGERNAAKVDRRP